MGIKGRLPRQIWARETGARRRILCRHKPFGGELPVGARQTEPHSKLQGAAVQMASLGPSEHRVSLGPSEHRVRPVLPVPTNIQADILLTALKIGLRHPVGWSVEAMPLVSYRSRSEGIRKLSPSRVVPCGSLIRSQKLMLRGSY